MWRGKKLSLGITRMRFFLLCFPAHFKVVGAAPELGNWASNAE
jgi:hypothetical protein